MRHAFAKALHQREQRVGEGIGPLSLAQRCRYGRQGHPIALAVQQRLVNQPTKPPPLMTQAGERERARERCATTRRRLPSTALPSGTTRLRPTERERERDRQRERERDRDGVNV
jgi:hypothetical protein